MGREEPIENQEPLSPKRYRPCRDCGTEDPSRFSNAPSLLRHHLCILCRRSQDRDRYNKRENKNAWVRWKNYRHGDLARGVPTITFGEALDLMQLPCHWCSATDLDRGLDRLDNQLGHSVDNVVPCCLRCNAIRGDLPVAAMQKLMPGLQAICQELKWLGWVPPYKRRFDEHKKQNRGGKH